MTIKILIKIKFGSHFSFKLRKKFIILGTQMVSMLPELVFEMVSLLPKLVFQMVSMLPKLVF